MSRKVIDGQVPVVPEDRDKGGRPTDLNQELIDKIKKVMLVGTPPDVAMALFDVSSDLMRLWVNKAIAEPEGYYGALIRQIHQTVAEYEYRELVVLEQSIRGRPAKYLMEEKLLKGKPVLDSKGQPLMVPVLDGNGSAIVLQAEIKPNAEMALKRLERRLPKWAKTININMDVALQGDSTEREVSEVDDEMSFKEMVRKEVKAFKESL